MSLLLGADASADSPEAGDEYAPTVADACTPQEVLERKFGCLYAPTTLAADQRTVIGSALLQDALSPGLYAQSTLGMTPGSYGDFFGVGFLGGTSLETTYFVDGQHSTGIQIGRLVSDIPIEFVDRIKVQTGGFAPEYRGSMGATVTIHTRRGTDRSGGGVFLHYLPGEFIASAKEFPDAGNVIVRDIELQQRIVTGFWHGGAILPGRLWYNVGLAADLTSWDVIRRVRRQTDIDQDWEPDVDQDGFRVFEVIETTRTGTTSQNVPVVARLDFAPTRNQQGTIAASGSYYTVPQDSGLGSPSATRTQNTQLTTDLAARWETTVGHDGATRIEASAGWHRRSSRNESPNDEYNDLPQGQTRSWAADDSFLDYESDTVRLGCNDGPGDDAYPHIENCPEPSRYYFGGVGHLSNDLGERRNADLRASHRVRLAGQHEIKGGLGFEEARLRTESSFSGGVIYDDFGATRWVELGSGPNYPEDCGTPDEPEQPCRFLASRVDDARTTLWTSFLQDSWSPVEQLTVTAGARLDRQEVQKRILTYELAPRFGGAYDWTKNGRARTFAYWGRVYESIPLSLNTTAFDESATLVRDFDGEYSHLYESSAMDVDSGIGGQYQDEILLGSEQVIADLVSVGLVLRHRELGRVIEDVRRNGELVITNPGVLDESLTPHRTYDGLTLTASTDPAAKFVVRASYTYSRLLGNYDGFYSGHTGQASPNLLSAFDTPELGVNSEGRLSLDRPHYFKLDGFARIPLRDKATLVAGGRVRARSGTLFTAQGRHSGYGLDELLLLPRGAVGRTPFSGGLDLHLAYRRAVRDAITLELYADLFNVFNERTADRLDGSYVHDLGNAAPIDGGDYADLVFLKAQSLTAVETGDPARRNTRFGEPLSYLAPLSGRLGLRLFF